jgi:hypothetical protein
MLRKASELLKANPQDPQAHQLVQQGQQMSQQGQAALKQNSTILNDMANDPKQHKVITKAFGIDDKNADSPERAAATAALKKQMGGQVGGGAAGMLSQLPQTQQLSPQAQGQQMAHQAGVIATPGQALQAEGKVAQVGAGEQKSAIDQMLKAEKQHTDAGLKTDALVSKLPQMGLQAEKNEDGTIKRNADGTMVVRNLTKEELEGNPELAEKYKQMQSGIDLKVAQAKAVGVNATANMMRAQAAQMIAQQAKDPNVIKNWVSQVADPKSGVTLAQVPAQLRGLVVNGVADSGLKLAKPLDADELKRSDLAMNAVKNIDEASDILSRRPDLFGPAGWGKTNMEKALAGGDPDALKYQAAINLANLPAVGIHGVRGKYALEDIGKLDSNMYLNPEAMKGVLGEIRRSASEFADAGGRQMRNPPAKPPAKADKAVDDFLLNLK